MAKPRPAHVVVIPNFLNLERVYRRAGTVSGPFTVLYAGWLSPWKGVPVLLDAFGEFVATCPAARLVLCGQGPDAGALKARADALGITRSVEFAGWIDRERMADAFARASVLVLPSYTEGMPNIILEAMAAGLPVIATRVGGIPDLIDDGRTGFLIAPGDVAALVLRLKQLAADDGLRRGMGERGRERLLQRFVDVKWWPSVLSELRGAEEMKAMQA